MNPRIAVLASGGGSTVEAFIRAGQRGEIASEVGLVIASRQKAGVFKRINDLNRQYGLAVKCALINHQTHPALPDEKTAPGQQTRAEETAILQELMAGNFDLVVLMGYMKLVGPNLIEQFGWLPGYKSVYQAKMVNTHPGLLPVTAGLYGQNIQQYVLDNHLPYAGQTLHVVAAGYDDGPVITGHKLPVELGDTAETLFERVQAAEKRYLPGDIEAFIAARRAYHQNREAD